MSPLACIAWGLLGLGHLVVAFGATLGRDQRWLALAFVLAAPVFAEGSRFWSTALTALAVIFALRLAELPAYQRRQRPNRTVLAAWLTLPMARLWPANVAGRAVARRKARGLLLRAALERGLWEVTAWSASQVPEWLEPWPARSALVMLFFTFNFMALADGVGALAALIGFEVEPVFEAPLLSRSPREFWSRRWNKFVARFLLRHVALALPRRWPAPLIVICVFGASGVLHEYFAWGAARERWVAWDMLAFFAVQGLAVIAEVRLPVRAPRPVGIATTFAWMTLTAPLFFHAFSACLAAFGYPEAWLPQRGAPWR